MSIRDEIVACAKKYLGVPYKSIYGGTGPEDGGFTCSGLTWRAYHDAGVDIPIAQGIHSYYTGSYNGWETQAGWVLNHGHYTDDADQLEVGDLVFYSPAGDMEHTGHVAIYAGDGMVVHANGAPVSVDPLSYGGNFVGGGWPLEELPDSDATGGVARGEWTTIPYEGEVRCDFDMNVRDYPSTEAGNVVARYEAGETINVDGLVINDGYTWLTYVGASSGKRRYVAITGDFQFGRVVK